jgi:hypothetical protein
MKKINYVAVTKKSSVGRIGAFGNVGLIGVLGKDDVG